MGVTRQSYGPGETAVADYLSRFAREEGLSVHIDRAANLIFSQKGVNEDTPAVWIGSHIDSVPQGGNFDGLAGVIAGLLILVASQRENRRLPVPVKVAAFRGEESAWYGRAYMGSSAIFGRLTAEDLQRQQRISGETLGRYWLKNRCRLPWSTGFGGMSALTLFTVLGMPSIQAPFLAIFATMRSAASPT